MDRRTDHFHGRHYRAAKISGPVPFLNPTTRYLSVHKPSRRAHASGAGADGATTPGSTDASLSRSPSEAPGIYHVWRSRDNRKGRHAVRVHRDAAAASATTTTPRPTNSLAGTAAGIAKMARRFPVWDVSYDVALVFTLGSCVWVINAFFVWLPVAFPGTEFANEEATGGGVTAFVGATIFEFGAVLAMLEAVNENRSDCFGWALEEALEDFEGRREGGGSGVVVLKKKRDVCRHHHRHRRAWLKPADDQKDTDVEKNGADLNGSANGNGNGTPPKDSEGGGESDRKWQWCPSWYELRTHYLRDIGFLACLAQMIGATIFWISGIVGIPPALNRLSVPAENGIYWLPQVVGGTGFIISSVFFMLETQPKWYKPALNVLGWHIGFWNLVGAIGFTLCGALGFDIDGKGMEYASTLSTFIGSWAFLIGSVIQWYESLDKYPIVIVEDNKSLEGSEGPAES